MVAQPRRCIRQRRQQIILRRSQTVERTCKRPTPVVSVAAAFAVLRQSSDPAAQINRDAVSRPAARMFQQFDQFSRAARSFSVAAEGETRRRR